MKRFMLIFSVLFILMWSFDCNGYSNTKMVYELQERCGKTAEEWSKQHSEVMSYKAHYNEHLNKCIIFATLIPITSSNGSSSYFMLYDPNANNTLAQYTVRSSRDAEDNICIINGKNYGNNSKEKWESFRKELMEE